MEETRMMSPVEGMPDEATFRRVWQRVMPDQSLSPVVLRESAPAVQPPKDHYIEGLERVMDGVRQWQHSLERMSLRHQGKTATALRTLSVREGQQLRRLATLYFLLTDGHYHPPVPAVRELLPLRDSLRQGFLAEMGWEKNYTHLVNRLEGESLVEVGEELRQTALEQGRQIRVLLEGMGRR